MNPQFEQSQGLRLPQPSLESNSVQADSGTYPQPERREGGVETAAAAPAIPAPAPAPLPTIPLGVATQTQIMQDMPAVTAPAAGGDDSADSALDEEWVDKAKQIVEQTHTDPYRQSNELSKFKADYLQVRHNKIIKTAEERSK